MEKRAYKIAFFATRNQDDALDIMQTINLGEGGVKYAILGSMLELGDQEEELHREIGRYVVSKGINELVCVGTEAKWIGEAALANGMPADSVRCFATSDEVADKLRADIDAGDLLLVKGSQSTRTEKIVKGIMQDPLDAENLLVRQSKKWLNT